MIQNESIKTSARVLFGMFRIGLELRAQIYSIFKMTLVDAVDREGEFMKAR